MLQNAAECCKDLREFPNNLGVQFTVQMLAGYECEVGSAAEGCIVSFLLFSIFDVVFVISGSGPRNRYVNTYVIL